MKPHKRILIVSLGMLVLLGALACGGGGTPVAMTDIPLYPGAKPVKAEDNFMAALIVEAFEEEFASEADMTSEIKTFSVPADTTSNDIVSFYDDKLSGTDWKLDEEFSESSEEFTSRAWFRGSGDSEQALVVVFVPDITGEGAILVNMLFSE